MSRTILILGTALVTALVCYFINWPATQRRDNQGSARIAAPPGDVPDGVQKAGRATDDHLINQSLITKVNHEVERAEAKLMEAAPSFDGIKNVAMVPPADRVQVLEKLLRYRVAPTIEAISKDPQLLPYLRTAWNDEFFRALIIKTTLSGVDVAAGGKKLPVNPNLEDYLKYTTERSAGASDAYEFVYSKLFIEEQAKDALAGYATVWLTKWIYETAVGSNSLQETTGLLGFTPEIKATLQNRLQPLN